MDAYFAMAVTVSNRNELVYGLLIAPQGFDSQNLSEGWEQQLPLCATTHSSLERGYAAL